MKLILIGANGQLGSDIYKVFSKKNKIIAFTHKQLDITDSKKVKKTITFYKPELIINTAAYHLVDEIETNPEKAFSVNAIAQKNLSEAAKASGSAIVYFSTDYVFGQDKERKKAYRETDTLGPVNTYGLSKLAGEYLTQIYAEKYFIIRTSGLYGSTSPSSKRENFVEKMIRLSKQNSEIKVVNDQILSPTYTLNLARNLLLLLSTSKFGIYHIVSEGQCSWWQFARKIFQYLNVKTNCKPVSSMEFQTEAKRPNYSALENHNLTKIDLKRMKSWETNLKDYLKEKKYI